MVTIISLFIILVFVLFQILIHRNKTRRELQVQKSFEEKEQVLLTENMRSQLWTRVNDQIRSQIYREITKK